MTQETLGLDSLWGRVLVVIPTLSGNQTEGVVALKELLCSAGADVAVVANGRSALDALRANGVTPLTRNRNLGFAAAVNLGRASRTETYDWILIVNDDVAIDSLDPFKLLAKHTAEAAIVTFGPELSRPIPRIGGTFAALAMIPLGRARSRDPINVPFALPKGSYTPFSVVAIQRALWDDLSGLDERFPFMYEDADFARRAELRGATRLALHVPEQIKHARGVAGRSNVRTVFPTVTWSALQYLEKWGLGATRARITCLAALLLRVPLLPLSRAPLGEHFRALIAAIGVATGFRRASLPEFEDA